MDHSQNTKRIAKNTLMLYIRMFVSMLISLYTSRVILAALGVVDYGIYNVVGGIVAMFGVITSTLNTAINRFLTFELGIGDEGELRRVFSTSLTIQLLLSLIIVIMAETVGLWYLNHVMVIPQGRMVAANWCFQFSILTCVIGLIAVPYNSAVIAHERMSVFAYMSIFGAVITLLIAFLIEHNPFDRLVFYGLLLLLASLLTQQVYMWYCIKKFAEAKVLPTIDKQLLGRMFGFAGWNFIGASSGILRQYGGNLLVNYYFGPIVNAALGISNAVNHAITQFSTNFTVAIKPQITKSFASKDWAYMNSLIYRGARFAVFMMLFISAPVLLNTRFILGIWLVEVPAHAVLFTQLTLIYTMVEMVSSPLVTAMLATGDIRNYQICVGGIQCLNIPIAWVALHCGCAVEIVTVVSILIAHCSFAVRLLMLKNMIRLNPVEFFIKVYLKIVLVAVIGLSVPFAACCLIPRGWNNFFITTATCVFTLGTTILYFGCNGDERAFVFSALRNILIKLHVRND